MAKRRQEPLPYDIVWGGWKGGFARFKGCFCYSADHPAAVLDELVGLDDFLWDAPSELEDPEWAFGLKGMSDGQIARLKEFQIQAASWGQTVGFYG